MVLKPRFEQARFCNVVDVAAASPEAVSDLLIVTDPCVM